MTLRVLFITREYPPYIVGGIATHVYNLANALKKLGVSVSVVSFGDFKKSYNNIIFINPISSIINRSNEVFLKNILIPIDILRFTEKVIKIIKKKKFDIIHVQEPYVGGLLKNKNKVTTIHDTSYGEIKSIASNPRGFRNIERIFFYTSLGFLMEYASIATSKLIIVPALHVKEEIVHKYKLGRDKVIVMMNGIDPKKCNRYLSLTKEEAKEKLGINPDSLFIFTSGQHIARKRLDVFLQALYILKKKNNLNKIEVGIGGDGPQKSCLEKLAKKFNINKEVKFLGWLQRDLLELYYRASDIFIISSDYEAGPITMLEAMISEAAVISTNIPGFPALAKNQEEAYLIPTRDPLALTNAINELILNDDLRKKLSFKGKLFAYKFTLDKIAERTLKIYERILKY